VVPTTEPCALRSTQPLKVSTRDFSWGKGGRCVWLTTYHPCSAETSRKSGALIYPEPLGAPRPVAGDLYFHSFLLEFESTPGPLCDRKEWHHRESNPRPSGLQCSASTKCATRQLNDNGRNCKIKEEKQIEVLRSQPAVENNAQLTRISRTSDNVKPGYSFNFLKPSGFCTYHQV